MASNDPESTSFKLSLQQSLLDPLIVQQYQEIFKPMLTPLMDALNQSNALVESLRNQLKVKDWEVSDLRNEVDTLKVMYDDLEQHGRRGSMRVFGVPEHTTGTVDDKVLSLINKHLQVTPPLALADIEMVHRLGKPPPKPFICDPAPCEKDTGGDSDEPAVDAAAVVEQSPTQVQQPKTPPRAIIVKFASRRTKTLVMRNKKFLKSNPFEAADGTVHTVYIADDLTKRRANLAYRARLLKRSGAIQDTWTFDSKILVKDLHNRIVPIKTEQDLNEFGQSTNTTQPPNWCKHVIIVYPSCCHDVITVPSWHRQ